MFRFRIRDWIWLALLLVITFTGVQCRMHQREVEGDSPIVPNRYHLCPKIPLPCLPRSLAGRFRGQEVEWRA